MHLGRLRPVRDPRGRAARPGVPRLRVRPLGRRVAGLLAGLVGPARGVAGRLRAAPRGPGRGALGADRADRPPADGGRGGGRGGEHALEDAVELRSRPPPHLAGERGPLAIADRRGPGPGDLRRPSRRLRGPGLRLRPRRGPHTRRGRADLGPAAARLGPTPPARRLLAEERLRSWAALADVAEAERRSLSAIWEREVFLGQRDAAHAEALALRSENQRLAREVADLSEALVVARSGPDIAAGQSADGALGPIRPRTKRPSGIMAWRRRPAGGEASAGV